MKNRPITLLGGEPDCSAKISETIGLQFDPGIGVWRCIDEVPGTRYPARATTRQTRSMEGIDQTERAELSTRITKTLEGIDQAGRSV